MKRNKLLIMIAIAVVIAMAAVSLHPLLTSSYGVDESKETEELEKINPIGPVFNADSAYAFTQAQCDFGPRAMNTIGHDLCEEWIVSKFEEYGCTVKRQKADLIGYDGTVLKATNIMASFRPELTTRILICAHWDSRPWADNDPDKDNWHKPVLAANDGASGVAVMIEIARLLQQEESPSLSPDIGIDFVCFDAEDWGTPQWEENQNNSENTWALGSQYFAENLPERYEARYGILLDMVGGQGARFYEEGISRQYAPEIVKKVWRAARQAGYGSYFPRQTGGFITDDHLPLNRKTNIPTIDIVPHYPDCEQSSFGPTWHTLDDNMEHIDRQTLKAVGQTLIQVLWTEK